MDSVPPHILEELARLGTGQTEHSTRTLLDHLTGVYRLLQQWDNPAEICLAGLFHSIYGTESFKTQTVVLAQRDHIRALIGERAEELAYLFCAYDKRHFVKNFARLSDYTLWDLFQEEEVALSEDTFRALVEMSLANMLEQLPDIASLLDEQVLFDLFNAWKSARPFASGKAYQQFIEYFRSLQVPGTTRINE